jgi:hypothetical protein
MFCSIEGSPGSDIAASVIVGLLQKTPAVTSICRPRRLLSKVGRVIDVGKEPGLFRLPADQ